MTNTKVLLDVSLGHVAQYECPDAVQVIGGPESDDISDTKLLEIAKIRACDGVVFLDNAVLRSNELCQLAAERSLSIVSMSTDDPVLAKQWLIRYLPAIANQIANGPFFGSVSKSGIRVIDPLASDRTSGDEG